MSSASEELEAVVLSLPRGERARLAERLLASLDEDPEVEEAWAAEVKRRLAAYHSGELKAQSVESVLREARSKVDDTR